MSRDPSAMEFTMHNPHQSHHHHHHHHHPHHHHPSGPASPHSTSRCPALRAAAEQRAYQIAPNAPRGSGYYDPVHGNITNRDPWPHRVPQSWHPAFIPPSQDPLVAGILPGLAPSNQPPAPAPASYSAASNIPHAANVQESQAALVQQQGALFQSYRPTMHPLPHLPPNPTHYGGSPRSLRVYASSGQPIHHSPNRPAQYANNGPNTTGALFPPPPPPTEVPSRIGPSSATTSENSRPNQQAPSIFGGSTPRQNENGLFSTQTQGPTTAATATSEENQSRSVSSTSSLANSSPRLDIRPGRMDSSSAESRRSQIFAHGRVRRNFARGSPPLSHWPEDNPGGYRENISLLDFVQTFPGVLEGGDSPVRAQPVFRGSHTGKRVASKKALASLQSVDIADLPESERTCVICYNDFGVANPEGLNEAPLRLPKCKHVFGDHCIKKWFEESDSCPYCRDKVHSEPQHVSIRGNRSTGVLRLMRQYHATNPNNPRHVHGQTQNHSSADPEQPLNFDPDSYTAAFFNRQQPSTSNTRNSEGSDGYSRPSQWASSPDRHSPPSDNNDRPRTRPRHHRARGSQTWSRPPGVLPSGLFGGIAPNNTSQTSVRRRSRSRSPLDPESSSRARGTHQRSSSNSPQQPRWFGISSQNSSPSHREFSGSSYSPPYYVQAPPFQSQLTMPADEFFHPLTSPPNEPRSPVENDFSFVQLRPEFFRSSTPPSMDGSSDVHMANSDHGTAATQFPPYQQS
ncbi:hypothetical protein F5Y16DRAFT_423407 [Xylariaceae sp. FL0255]|nr:hypothetical protein F5Y16DRAFT_423407 [Xylariaceae sp. FL0255]